MAELNQVHHFGLTISRRKRSARFYSHVLRMPFIIETVNSGSDSDQIYRLEEAVNKISWYQFGDAGIETFYLPRHPSSIKTEPDVRIPGFRYMGFRVDGFDDYLNHLAVEGADITRGSCEGTRCVCVCDPDGIRSVFFDSGKPAQTGRVTGIKEIGLSAADTEGYDDFFRFLNFEISSEGQDFARDLFNIEADAPLYGAIRLIKLPGATLPIPKRCFPSNNSEPLYRFCDTGIKHIAFYTDDIDNFYKNGVSAGVCFLFKPKMVGGGSKITYFLDPEGNTFEAIQVNETARAAARFVSLLRQSQMDAVTTLTRLIGF